jgi:hypothetical protein
VFDHPEDDDEGGQEQQRPDSPSLWRKARLINKFMSISPKVKRKTDNAKNRQGRLEILGFELLKSVFYQ